MNINKMEDGELEQLRQKIEAELEARKPKTTEIYFHRDKSDNYQEGEDLELTAEQLKNFVYTGYEVKVNIEIDYFGHAFATHLNDVALAQKVLI